MIPSMEDLPGEAAKDREYFTNIGIKSCVSLPLMACGKVLGFFSCSVLRTERTWVKEVVQGMQLLAHVFTNAIVRIHNDAQLQENLWDLAFHTLPIAIVDPDFAKQQMALMLRGVYLHPSGQMPAYEWNFSDVNPPVHAFATLFLHRTEQALCGETDLEFLKSAFNKLVLNFTWWVNRKDRLGKNVFEGGFLGLDNRRV